jgi:hypothetical protein
MARITTKKPVIFEATTEDGGKGLLIDGTLIMGHDAGDLLRLLEQVFMGVGNPPTIDGELYDLAHAYLNEAEARARYAEMRRW